VRTTRSRSPSTGLDERARLVTLWRTDASGEPLEDAPFVALETSDEWLDFDAASWGWASDEGHGFPAGAYLRCVKLVRCKTLTAGDCMLLLALALACQSDQQVSPTPDPDPGSEQDSGIDPAGDGGSDVDTGDADNDDDDGDAGGDLGDDPDPPEDTGLDDDEDDDPSEYIYEDDGEDDQESLLDIGEIEQGVVDLIEVLTWVDPEVLSSTYESLRLEGDDSCPYYYYDADGASYYGYDYWYDSCTADNGTSFNGYGYTYYYGAYSDGYYVYDDYAYINAYATITDRLGDSLDLAYYGYHVTYGTTSSNDRNGYAYMSGDVRWTSEDAEGTWLAEELSTSLYYSYNYYDLGNETALSSDGSISGIKGEVNAALLDDVYIYTAGLGSTCEAEPSGTISLRDSEGEWYHITFDGPAFGGAPVFTPDCNGCGQVSYRGEDLGEVCPDFSALLHWEGRPWN
jgi:hypothetical protein